MFVSGYVREGQYKEWEAMYIDDQLLAEILMPFEGQEVYLCYAFDTAPITMERFVELAIMTAEGLVDINFGGHYSDITGPLWLDEDLIVGGHDLEPIFWERRGQYGALVIQTEPIDLTLLAW